MQPTQLADRLRVKLQAEGAFDDDVLPKAATALAELAFRRYQDGLCATGKRRCSNCGTCVLKKVCAQNC